MKTLVVYDIVSNKVRKKVSDTCLDYGLERIQYSAFYGELSKNRREELQVRLASRLGKNEGNIRIIPVCDQDVKTMCEIDVKGE